MSFSFPVEFFSYLWGILKTTAGYYLVKKPLYGRLLFTKKTTEGRRQTVLMDVLKTLLVPDIRTKGRGLKDYLKTLTDIHRTSPLGTTGHPWDV